MEIANIKRIMQSTVHIIMTEPKTLLPCGIGSGCIIRFNGDKILLSVAHVTDKHAATCIDTGGRPVKNKAPLYSVGAMNYLDMYDITKYEQQINYIKKSTDLKEDIDFGQIDFSFALLEENVVIKQREIKTENFHLKPGIKLVIETDLTDMPDLDIEYGFFGRIKPAFYKGTPVADTFETEETFYGGLKFIKQIKNYYEFELPDVIKSNTDFTGTSGAPIMDKVGRIVSLITHGYEGGNKIYGIALSKFRSGVQAMILQDKLNSSSASGS